MVIFADDVDGMGWDICRWVGRLRRERERGEGRE